MHSALCTLPFALYIQHCFLYCFGSFLHRQADGCSGRAPVTAAAEFGADGRSIKEILLDIVDTPISPELLPANENGEIQQVTEDLVGPYELHDFFLYYFLRYGFTREKIAYMAGIAFDGQYTQDEIDHWLGVFMHRFFTQQFKRSCSPDGVKVGSVSLSPRGEFLMPSDATSWVWLDELEANKDY